MLAADDMPICQCCGAPEVDGTINPPCHCDIGTRTCVDLIEDGIQLGASHEAAWCYTHNRRAD